MKLKIFTFSLLAVMVAILVVATICEKTAGTPAVVGNIYGSWWFASLWAIECVTAIVYLIKRKIFRRPASALLHCSFIIILAGAFITHIFGIQGTMHLRTGETTNVYENKETGSIDMLPFKVSLKTFQLQTYPGTMSAMDYRSEVEVTDVTNHATMDISMNNIGEYGAYRFYQSGYDADQQGTYLSICHDPWGISVTYTGYALLVVSMLLFLVLPGEGFRRLLQNKDATKAATAKASAAKTSAAKATAVILLSFLSLGASAEGKVLPKDVAQQFGTIYTYYNGRICPLQTVARDFTTKLYGSPEYKGYTSEQVFTGWMLYAMSWLDEPIIKVKGKHTKELLGTDATYVSYADFFSDGRYLLEDAVADIHQGKEVADSRAITETDEKMNILRMHLNGQLAKIYPISSSQFIEDSVHHIDESLQDFTLAWFSQDENLPGAISNEQWYFIKHTLDYIYELSVMKDYKTIREIVGKIRKYQVKTVGAENLPTDTAFKSELLYNSSDYTKPLAMLLLAIGIAMFVAGLAFTLKGRKSSKWLSVLLIAVYSLSTLYLIYFISLRGIVSHHLPLANGYETMQFMSLCSLLTTLCLWKKSQLFPSFGLIMAGLTLLVSMMGQSNPQITPLMPVLSSPLLSIHVCIIMLSYTLFAFIMLNSIAGLAVDLRTKNNKPQQNLSQQSISQQNLSQQLMRSSRLMLYPAEFLLTAGIFIGAVWANVSWGRYWGWDPKEVWALITMLVYAFPLHRASLRWFERPRHFHIYMILAFLTVLITYFGVNFFLGGMHSYANS